MAGLASGLWNRLAEQNDKRLAEVDQRAARQMRDGIMTLTEIAHAQGREGMDAGRPYFEAGNRPADRTMRALDAGRVQPTVRAAAGRDDDDRGR